MTPQGVRGRQRWWRARLKHSWHHVSGQGELLHDFAEPDILFPPTYRVFRGEDEVVYYRKARPAYTDRVLVHSMPGCKENVSFMMYNSIDEFVSSDHKPVSALFTLRFKALPTLQPTPDGCHTVRLTGCLLTISRPRPHTPLPALSCCFHSSRSRTCPSDSPRGRVTHPVRS